jgi:hypothetical protein
MPQEHDDRGCRAALAAALGHDAPFTADELAAVESLTVVHARDLESLGACTGLRHLRVIASEIADFLFCEALAELAHLEVHCSVVQSLCGLAFCRELERVDLLFTSAEDSSHLLGSRWRRGTLVGNPWSQLSWDALREVTTGNDVFVELATDVDWRRTRALWTKAQACRGVIEGQQLLVRPGLPTLTGNVYDALALINVRLDLSAPTLDVAEVFRTHADKVDAPDLSALAQRRELGGQRDALRWIAAARLPPEDQAGLTAFVERFPGVVFTRTSPATVAALVHEGELPAWYTAILGALEGWLPAQGYPPVRFAGFDMAESPRASTVAGYTYHLGVRPHSDDDSGQALRAAGFVPLAVAMEDPDRYLAYRAGERTIYEYHDEDLREALAEGGDVDSSVYPAFLSYASMLAAIVSLHPDDRDPVLAQ